MKQIEKILQRETEKLARKEAEKRELQVSAWIASHGGVKKLLFGRWLFILCDMKGFKLTN